MLRFVIIFLLLVTAISKSYAVYDVNDNCKNAWMLLMDLEIDEAKALLAKEIEINPENYYAFKKHAKLVKRISRERIRDELNKIMMSQAAPKAFEPQMSLNFLVVMLAILVTSWVR